MKVNTQGMTRQWRDQYLQIESSVSLTPFDGESIMIYP
jgi:hypothetical protein